MYSIGIQKKIQKKKSFLVIHDLQNVEVKYYVGEKSIGNSFQTEPLTRLIIHSTNPITTPTSELIIRQSKSNHIPQ